MMTWAKEIKETAILKWNGVYDFEAKIGLKIESGSYILKTAESSEEIIESLKLRHKIFFQEREVATNGLGLDVDRYDSHFDHLIIIHKASMKIIGTYRLSLYDPALSYSRTEFDLTPIEELPGPHLELGRACVDSAHRSGTVISLLWRGIIDYMNISGAHTLFGCSSISTDSAEKMALLYKYFQDRGALSDINLASVTKNFVMPEFNPALKLLNGALTTEQILEAESLIPSLLKSYVKMGARIVSEPAFDKKFNCVDVLTLLKKPDMVNSLARRYQVVQ